MFSTVSTVRMGTPTFLRHAWPMTLGLLVCASVSVGHVLSSPASTTIQWLGAACLAVTLLGVIPESQAVLKASNQGVPVILDDQSDAGQAYSDAVDRLLGKEKEHRFLDVTKKGFFERLFGGR